MALKYLTFKIHSRGKHFILQTVLMLAQKLTNLRKIHFFKKSLEEKDVSAVHKADGIEKKTSRLQINNESPSPLPDR